MKKVFKSQACARQIQNSMFSLISRPTKLVYLQIERTEQGIEKVPKRKSS